MAEPLRNIGSTEERFSGSGDIQLSDSTNLCDFFFFFLVIAHTEGYVLVNFSVFWISQF